MGWSLTLTTVSGQAVWEPFPASACAWPVGQAGTLGIKGALLKVLVTDAGGSEKGVFEISVTGMRREATTAGQPAYSHCLLIFF